MRQREGEGVFGRERIREIERVMDRELGGGMAGIVYYMLFEKLILIF